MKIYQKYIGFQSYMGVTSKLSLPCPFQTQNGKGRGRPNFQATPSKFSKSIQLLKIFKWYYYDFLIFLLVSNFQKNPKAFMSISKGVRGLGDHRALYHLPIVNITTLRKIVCLNAMRLSLWILCPSVQNFIQNIF